MIKKLSDFIVEKRFLLVGVMLIIALCSVFWMKQVESNGDLTKYLPDDSKMKQGMDIMTENFPEIEMAKTIRVMYDDLDENEKQEVLEKLRLIPYVSSVEHDDSEAYNRDNHTLFIVNSEFEYRSPEMKSIEEEIQTLTSESKTGAFWKSDDTSIPDMPLFIIAAAIVFLTIILFAMSGSWFEPVLFLGVIGIAVLINMGTNIILGTVSKITFSIAALLQLALSMDYSIILINRYRQEKINQPDNTAAIKNAIVNSFVSITSSAFTTIVGLLMLSFMSFKIGMDMGVVLAKGVFCSMICVLTILPCLILLSDKILEKTKKKVLNIPVKRIAHTEYKLRAFIGAFFVIFCAVVFWMQSQTEIVFTLKRQDLVADIFPAKNSIVMLYENGDESKAAEISAKIEENPMVDSVMGYEAILGKAYSPDELVELISGFGIELDQSEIELLFMYFQFVNNQDTSQKMSLLELVEHLSEVISEDSIFANFLNEDLKQKILNAEEMIDNGKKLLVSDQYSRMIITTYLPEEDKETTEFLDQLSAECDEKFAGEYYLIGNSVMAYEMQKTFSRELVFITLLTATVIFLIVAISFRSVFIALLLVLLVQSGVYTTVSIIHLRGGSVFYIALLVVECILMGATIDYGILLTNYYREKRKPGQIEETLRAAYEGSIHTILTSGLILIIVTAILTYLFKEPTVSEIVGTISLGALSAVILILIVLPGLLALCDKWIAKKQKK